MWANRSIKITIILPCLYVIVQNQGRKRWLAHMFFSQKISRKKSGDVQVCECDSILVWFCFVLASVGFVPKILYKYCESSNTIICVVRSVRKNTYICGNRTLPKRWTRHPNGSLQAIFSCVRPFETHFTPIILSFSELSSNSPQAMNKENRILDVDLCFEKRISATLIPVHYMFT